MNPIVVVAVAALVAGAAAAASIGVTHGRVDPIDPDAEIRWLVRRLERRPRAMAWVRRRLDRTTATGLMATAAFVTLVVTAAVVGALFEMFTHDALVARWDASVANWSARHVDDGERDVLVRITDLGGSTVVLAALGLVGAVELFRRRWSSAAFLVVVIGGQFAVNNLLKVVVARDRPEVARLVGAGGHSFPSGHTVAAAATWSAIALVMSRSAPRVGRMVAAALAAAIAAAVGTTRALLGVHWLTDVLAGLAVGWGWFALVAILFGGRRQRAAAPVEQAAHRELPAMPGGEPAGPRERGPVELSRRRTAPLRSRRRRAGAAGAR